MVVVTPECAEAQLNSRLSNLTLSPPLKLCESVVSISKIPLTSL